MTDIPEAPVSKIPRASVPPALGSWKWQAFAVVICATLFVLAFPDYDVDLLVWVCLVPLFFVTRGVGGKRGFLLGWLTGFLIEGVGFFWILHAILNFTNLPFFVGFLIFLAWDAFSSLSWAILGWLLGRCRTPVFAHVAIAVWVAVECYFPRVFDWQIGGALYQRDWLRQAADIFGAHGLSYVILLANVLVYLLIEWRLKRVAFPRGTFVVVSAIAIALPSYGFWRLGDLRTELEEVPALKVAMIQPMTEPREAVNVVNLFRGQLRQTLDLGAENGADLGLWPEGADPYPFSAVSGQDPLRHHRSAAEAPSIFDAASFPLVVGGTSFDENDRPFNTAAYILPSGEQVDGARVHLYHKNRLLVFGEKLPLQDFYPDWILDRISVRTIGAGTENPLLTLKARTAGAGQEFPFRNLICYEAVLPGYVRESSDGADFLVNLTEDIWYGKTAHISQHASVLRMRGVETRTPILRCTNVGPSGVIDVTGEFSPSSAVFSPDAKLFHFRPHSPSSFYVQIGFLFPLFLLLGALPLFVRRIVRGS